MPNPPNPFLFGACLMLMLNTGVLFGYIADFVKKIHDKDTEKLNYGDYPAIIGMLSGTFVVCILLVVGLWP